MRYYIKIKEKVVVDRISEYVVEAKSPGEAEFLFREDPSKYDGELIEEFDAENQSYDHNGFEIIKIDE